MNTTAMADRTDWKPDSRFDAVLRAALATRPFLAKNQAVKIICKQPVAGSLPVAAPYAQERHFFQPIRASL